jgi:hypothetical protein
MTLLDEVARWQSDDFWQYTAYAAVAYIRAAASRAGVPVRQACQDLSEGLQGPVGTRRGLRQHRPVERLLARLARWTQ